MAAIKITNFLGIAPKISPELLPNTASQIANNCKLYSGDLLPYPQPVIVGNTNKTGALRTLYALRNPANSADLKWLSWATDVDIAVATATENDEQRFYYTGDGVPKVSNYELATTGVGAYPIAAYDLGLPLPTTTLTTVAQSAEASSTTASYARAANVTTIVTSAPHGLVTNDFTNINGFTFLTGTYSDDGAATTTVTITGHGLITGAIVTLDFTSGTGVDGAYTITKISNDVFTVAVTAGAPDTGDVGLDLSSFNSSSVQVTVVNTTTFTYANTGFTSTTVAYTTGVINKAGTITQSRARDSGNLATIVTAALHYLRTGNVVTVTGFPAATTTVATFNASNVEVTVINATTITYFCPGEAVSTVADGNGKVTLAGLTQARSYLYTWYTPWLEESIGSEPSDDLYIKEGQTVTVSGLPTAKPTGNNFIRGVRLYRTLPSVSGTEYFLLSTLWFPTALTRVARASNVSTVTTGFPHNLSVDDRFKISACTVASFDITGGIVVDVIDDYTFTYAQVAGNVASTTVAAGTLYHDVSENPPTSTARYWGDSSYNFVDDFDSRNLNTLLASDNYDAPPDNLEGLAAVQNNILVGFVGNKMYFSEPGQPHAWPQSYAITVEYPIVGISAVAGSFLVTTTSYPYLVSGNDPAARMAVARIDANYPCLNRKSMVTMGYGIVYATHEGLAVYSPSSGPQIITKALYNSDTWNATLDPTTINAQYYNENYLASHSTGGIIFEQDAKTGGFFVDTTFSFTASWYDALQGTVFVISGTNGDVYEWDDMSQPALTMEWKSKVIVTKDMINLGAVRIVADYTTPSTIWDEDTTQWQLETTTWDEPDDITFTLWVDKQQLFQTVINDDAVFRLPTGYRSDTFEVGVEGNVRVRAIYLGETPTGLRTA